MADTVIQAEFEIEFVDPFVLHLEVAPTTLLYVDAPLQVFHVNWEAGDVPPCVALTLHEFLKVPCPEFEPGLVEVEHADSQVLLQNENLGFVGFRVLVKVALEHVLVRIVDGTVYVLAASFE